MTGSTITFGILIFDDVEVLDACGPFEVFSTAARLVDQFQPRPVVRTVATQSTTVVARGGLRLLADHTVGQHVDLDVLVVPGGITAAVEEDARAIEWIRTHHQRASLTAAVCTGAFLLAQARVLDGRVATTHWEDEEELASRWPAVEVQRDPRWVEDGDVITSAGISAGIDMSLHVVRRLYGEDLARRTAKQMEYDWCDTPLPGLSGG